MDTFERLRMWLAESLGLSVEAITPSTTLGDLFQQQRQPEPASPGDEVNRQDSFLDGLNPDSLDMVEMVMILEERFDIQLPDAVAERDLQRLLDKRTTVQQIAEWIDRL